MDFREYKYVVTIAKWQSVTKAAQELYVSQPTLSKFVKNIENALGQPLFKRLGNKFQLTYAGERYVETAKKMLDLKKQLDQELTDITRNDVGELKIAFPIMRGTYMLPITLPIFHHNFPQVKVKIHESNSTTLEDLLLQGEIDLAFFNMPVKSSDVDYELIAEEEVVLVMSPDHPLAYKGIPRKNCKYPWMDIRTLQNEGFILQVPNQRTRIIADQIFKDAGFEPHILLEVRNILASVQLALSGYGVTFVSETHLRHIDSKVRPACFSVGDPKTTSNFVAAFRRGIYLPHYAKDYIQIVKNYV